MRADLSPHAAGESHMEFSNRSSLRTQGPIRRGLSLRHSSRGLFSLLRPGVMGPCVRRDDLLRDCTRPRPINVRLNSVICDSPAMGGWACFTVERIRKLQRLLGVLAPDACR